MKNKKVIFLNFFRTFFKLPILEAALARLTNGRSPLHFYSKLVPNAYQYKKPAWRTVNHEDIKLVVDISDYLGHFYYYGFLDKSQKALFDLCEPGFVAIDVGTNIGFTALKMASICKPGKVIGFEPDPYNYSLCIQNLALNNLPNIQVLNIALGENEQALPMEIRTPSNRGGNRIIKNNVKDAVIVAVKPLDIVVDELGIQYVNVVKLDVEGYELKVLHGAEKTLRKFKPALFIELDDNNLRDQDGSAETLISFLFDLGYASITDAKTGKVISLKDNFSHCHFDILAK